MWPVATSEVAWSVSQSVTAVSHAKLDAPIVMLLRILTCGPKEPSIKWGSRSPMPRQFRGEKWWPITVCRNSAMSSAKTAELIEMSLSFVTWSHVGQGTMYSMGSRSPCEGAILKAKRGRPRTCRRHTQSDSAGGRRSAADAGVHSLDQSGKYD